jgi:hypothetical protein
MSDNALKNAKKTQIGTPFKKGNPGGPGRPKGSSHLKCLEEAMAARAKDKKTLWEHAVDRAYLNDSVLIAIIKKFIPDKTSTEISTPEPIMGVFKVITNENNRSDKDISMADREQGKS